MRIPIVFTLFTLALSLTIITSTYATADVDLSKIIVTTEPAPNVAALSRNADAIVYGWFDSANEQLTTGQTVASGKLVNFVQTLHAERVFKDGSKTFYRVLTTGIEPLPDAEDTLNQQYPGPMVEGRYVCFLKQVRGSDTYTIVGGWQGVYPIHEGKTIALEEGGFPQLGGLTLDQLQHRLNQNG